MRKVILILAVVLFTVPAWAAVTINCDQVGTTNNVLVSYNSTGETKRVRAFALDITVSTGTITAVDDSVSTWYTIYPGSIVIVDGNVTDWGTAVADPCDLPSDTKGGIGTNGITIEMGALFTPPGDPNKPPISGNLLRFTVSTLPCTVTIVENQGRGGVVLTDPNLNPTVPPSSCVIGQPPDCLIGGNAGTKEYTDWVAWNKPNCWCYCRQCRGDSDAKKTGTMWVTVPDLNLLIAAYGKTNAQLALIPNGICADFDHKVTATKRVTVPDLNILIAYYGKPVASVPRCNLAHPPNYPTIYTGPYNFWCDSTVCSPPGIVCP
jgi:hypothetical protein